ncbi:MAG: myo-inositol 2-dehydrogenase [Candidatus Yanofskybacteria bacterium RIFCSPHIGHO2_01_FULL_44_17]|uniref:Myo-inositol 2-dehydrogenase n=1 Tax=Candidatus Yanofskybacteria bacterium RIFCSPHIGHO2_01_FULL_44_17 TaxID=1802668 RepID=A0A1F8ETF6_9BACT|nr:MAG: myo-inositol 2-dehydrogenase [Candidatus Yanofskybacteria bacterium RIFCSPHIGHO2_01_FULL_44_17]
MATTKNKILLVGAGYMAVEYAKVLKAMKLPFVVIGRGEASARSFQAATGEDVTTGGIEGWLKTQKDAFKTAIVAVGVDQLANTARKLISGGVKSILLEKPGGLTAAEIKSVARAANRKKVSVYVAYNRRFYASTRKAIEIIRRDGGVKSFTFDFTEWSHQIVKLKISPAIKKNWFLANSSHVVDLAFFLGGEPTKMSSYRSGSLKWHPSGSVFAGAGTTSFGAMFSYSANWAAPGRWGLEIMTAKSRLIFRPLEKLQIQKIGSVAVEEVAIDDKLDKQFKPGVYRQVEAFLSNKRYLPTINEQVRNLKHYKKIERN